MSLDGKIKIQFEKWKERIVNNKIEAICKPCWDLKYCPYGSLVEQFPLSDDAKYKCIIFGHQCPVYTVAEPFTETKELRNITRYISFETRMKIARRDNYKCQICGKSLRDEELNFDHIIPWSKGGSSDGENIRVLCESCNSSRSNQFESELLIANMKEIQYEPIRISEDMLVDLLNLFYCKSIIDNSSLFLKVIEDDPNTDEFMLGILNGIEECLSNEGLFPIKKKLNILRYRWGYQGGKVHSIQETMIRYKVSQKYYLDQEDYLLRQIGLALDSKYNTDTLLNYKVDVKTFEEMVKVKLAYLSADE